MALKFTIFFSSIRMSFLLQYNEFRLLYKGSLSQLTANEPTLPNHQYIFFYMSEYYWVLNIATHLICSTATFERNSGWTSNSFLLLAISLAPNLLMNSHWLLSVNLFHKFTQWYGKYANWSFWLNVDFWGTVFSL